MKYLKYFKTDVDCQNYFNSDEFVTPNVSYVEDADMVYYKPDDLIIMTSESNPEVMKVCYNQGWAASPYEMYASEAARVTSIGTAFKRLGGGNSGGYGYNDYSSGNNYSGGSTSFTFSFDEFKYFTGVTSIDNNAFRDSNIVSITIPDSVTSIGGFAFYGCSGLTSITIPDSVTSIGESAFESCVSLPAEGNIRYAGRYLVEAADKSLSTYTIKEGTKWIGGCAFHSCNSLTSITIPDSVTSIEGGGLNSCSSLNEITCLATTAPKITKNTFYGVKSSGILKVPAGSNYRSWMSTENYYLGKYNWHIEEIQH